MRARSCFIRQPGQFRARFRAHLPSQRDGCQSLLQLFQRTGTGGQATQPMEMASSGARRAVYRFSRDGGILGAEGADSAEMTITVPAVGQSVPVHQRASWKAVRSGK